MITPIDVLDSAVKIGLGAAISGLATYWLAKANHDKTLKKERAQRKRDMLESVAQHVAAFNHVALRHWAAVINWVRITPTGGPMSSEKHAELTILEQQVFTSAEQLVNADAKLLLLGESKCYELLRDYGDAVKVFRQDSIEARDVTFDQLVTYKEMLKEKRESLFVELSNVYRKI